jgi:hypothetical protein
MNTSQLQEIFYSAFQTGMIKMTSKPWQSEEVDCLVDFENLSPPLMEAIEGLPIVEMTDDQYNKDGFFSYILDDSLQFYIVVANGETYFVDNQGFQYCRYVALINNLPHIKPNKPSTTIAGVDFSEQLDLLNNLKITY